MSRIAYLIELDPREVPQLAYVAGLLSGQGVAQGAVLANALDRMQLVEVPDDFGNGDEPQDADTTSDEQAWEGEGGQVLDFPQPVNDEGEELSSELPAIDPLADPTSPESLGIQANLPAPPPPPPPMSPQDSFGAGPPPRD